MLEYVTPSNAPNWPFKECVSVVAKCNAYQAYLQVGAVVDLPKEMLPRKLVFRTLVWCRRVASFCSLNLDIQHLPRRTWLYHLTPSKLVGTWDGRWCVPLASNHDGSHIFKDIFDVGPGHLDSTMNFLNCVSGPEDRKHAITINNVAPKTHKLHDRPITLRTKPYCIAPLSTELCGFFQV